MQLASVDPADPVAGSGRVHGDEPVLCATGAGDPLEGALRLQDLRVGAGILPHVREHLDVVDARRRPWPRLRGPSRGRRRSPCPGGRGPFPAWRTASASSSTVKALVISSRGLSSQGQSVPALPKRRRRADSNHCTGPDTGTSLFATRKDFPWSATDVTMFASTCRRRAPRGSGSGGQSSSTTSTSSARAGG